MKKLFRVLTILFMLPLIVNAKEITLKEFEFSKGNYEVIYGVTETLDDGYVIVGETSTGIDIVKFNHDDKMVWHLEEDYEGYAYDIDIDSKGNIYVVGSTRGNNTVSYDRRVGFVWKIDKDGKFIKRIIIGNGKDEKYYLDDLEVDDDKIVVVGQYISHWVEATDKRDPEDGNSAYSVILDLDLNVIKENHIDYDYEDYFYGVDLTSDGGYVAVGFSQSLNLPDYKYVNNSTVPIIAKYDKDYKLEWLKYYPVDAKLNDDNSCTYGYEHAFLDVVETCDGNYAVVGEVGKLTSFEIPNIEPSSSRYGVNRLTEMLGEEYNGLEIEEDDNILNYESSAAVVVKYDKKGNIIDEYVENTIVNEGFTDILELDNCSLLVTGNFDHQPNFEEESDLGAKNHSFNTKSNEKLGINTYECLYGFDKDVKLVLLNEKLDEEWSKLYNGNYYDTLYNISPVGKGEFVAVGGFDSDEVGGAKYHENVDGLVIRLKITYEINVEKTENGKFDAVNQHGKADVVYHGDVATITTTPEEGYKVDTIKVVDSNGNEVPVSKVENNKYEYHINDDTWVTVTFKNVEVVIPPKTGVSTYLLLAVVVSVIGYVAYNLINKKNMFKKM